MRDDSGECANPFVEFFQAVALQVFLDHRAGRRVECITVDFVDFAAGGDDGIARFDFRETGPEEVRRLTIRETPADVASCL